MTPRAPVIGGLGELAGDYDAVLSDVWGVIHNGVAHWPDACAALAELRSSGRPVVLISNAPRPAGAVRAQIDALGVPRDAYDAIVTSGDITRAELSARPGVRVFHLGPDRDRPIFEGLDVAFAGEADCELVVNSGLFRDDVEVPGDYDAMLGRLRARAAPMICANPDIVVERGERLVWCAGALAERYEAIGGHVVWAGKPHRPIYDRALVALADIMGRSPAASRVLAIGDSVRTDIAGASAAGFDALFVAAGIHGVETGRDGDLDADALHRLFAEAGVRPRAAMARLRW